jgi:hypothetical protein
MAIQQIYNQFKNRKYVIFNVSELEKINFTEVLQTDSSTVRRSIDLTKTFVKWEGEMPNCVTNLTTKEGPYTQDEMISILETPEWLNSNMDSLLGVIP